MQNSRTVTAASPLLEILFAAWPEAKRKQVRTWLKVGAVTVNGRGVTRFDHALRAGDKVAILAKGVAAPETVLPGGLRVRHEDEALVVVEKPAGLLSIATDEGGERTAYSILTEHVRGGNRQSRARVWIVHRLDRETSGLMVFAKTEEAKRVLQENWDAAEKKYFAVVEGAPPGESGRLESHLDESDVAKVRVAEKPGPQARHAVTHYRVKKKGRATTLLELTLETGRRHQIRVQLAEAGCAIVGDKRYGARTNPIRRVALHAARLSFPHPVTGATMKFESPLPGELGRLVE
jgi:23S rRNA pseudouridine1911/1915/1917 synthase